MTPDLLGQSSIMKQLTFEEWLKHYSLVRFAEFSRFTLRDGLHYVSVPVFENDAEEKLKTEYNTMLKVDMLKLQRLGILVGKCNEQ